MAEAKQVPAPPGDRANDRSWLLAILGIAAFHLSYLLAGGAEGVWVPAMGVGIALTAWLGYWLLPLLALDAFAVGVIVHHDGPFVHSLLEAVSLTSQIGLVWWAFSRLAGGSRRLEDPRSATVFLILAPGAIEAVAAVVEAGATKALGLSTTGFIQLIGNLWISKALGTLALVPALLAVVTPWLIKHRVVAPEPDARHPGGSMPRDWTWGEAIETAGLVLGNCVLAVVVEITQRQSGLPPWPLWGFGVLLAVWASLRQGLRGGTLTAGMGACVALSLATYMGVTAALLSPLQGNLLAQCSAALLVGASAGWVRASEARYRQVVSHIPVMLYSAHLPRSLKVRASAKPATSGVHPRSDPDLATGSILIDMAEITLVSSACKHIYGCEVEQMLGPYRDWLERIVEADRELVRAAVHQLCLQKGHVACEYRLVQPGGGVKTSSSSWSGTESHRWVRDTMVPFFATDGLMAGWEGVVEDITEQQALSRRLRRTSNMLQALITNLPTGVYFVQGPLGQPILVNARARQLLGQREDLAAGVAYLSQVYRLHRADGSIYPTAELPVTKALKMGITSMANDIVIHHADGRRVPLITWGAPVDLGGNGKPDAAVWVLEDLTALHQAELARRESENRLRAVIETMAEGIVVQSQSGVILECNAAAAAILGMTVETLVGQTGLAAGRSCLQGDGSELPREQHPDVMALRGGVPVRNVILGIPLLSPGPVVNGAPTPPVRWILVNSMPLTSATWIGPQHRAARVVTTFADITEHRQAIEVVRLAREKYQELVESLPLMVLQFDATGQITFLNRTTERLTGWPAGTLQQAGLWQGLIVEEDRAQFTTALARTLEGYHARAEFRYRSKEGHAKVGLALMQPLLQQGVLQGTTCLVVDMTVQRSLEAELQRAQQLELVGRLAGGTVHDFNNLLTVMIGLAQLAQGTLAPGDPAQEYLQNLTDAGEQASHLAGQLLTFSKQRTSASCGVPLDVVPLHAVVQNSLRLLKSVLRADIRVECDLSEGELYVRGEENQLKQVIMNLCLNARDAMPHGGKLLLQSAVVSGASLDTKNHPAPAPKRLVRLTIQDSGAGMDQATLQRIFEPFFSTKERGTGLGLAVVRQIVESFGGDIKVWSQPGEGTRMEVYFQQAAAKPAGLEDEPARLGVGS